MSKGNKYLSFRHAGSSATGKTHRWDVVSTGTGIVLGVIKWYGRWRQYAFFPTEETLFNPDCLDSISQFARERTDNQRTIGGEPYGSPLL